jgi:hypothetical protein
MDGFRYRLIDRSGSEIGIVTDERSEITEGDAVTLLYGARATVLRSTTTRTARKPASATLVVETA